MSLPRALTALGDERFISLTTFLRSGNAVSTPVWIARDGDVLAVTTRAGSDLFRGWGSEQSGTETVTLRRLADEGLPNLGPTLLKLDSQGHDFPVLDGAGGLLERCQLLIIELSFVPLYATSVPAAEALSRLDTLGFGLVDLFPVTRDGDRQLRLVEADGLLARL